MDEQLREAIVGNIMRIWVQPEIDRRITAGVLPAGFLLDRAQVVMNVGQSPQVRLNDEVRIRYDLQIERVGPTNPETGETPAILDLRFDLPPDDDVNAGWMFIINLYGAWQPYFDFQYNVARAKEHAAAAREFIDSATSDHAQGRVRPFVENLWSAAELMAKTLLLLLPDEQVLRQRSHPDRRKKLEQYVKSVGRHDRFLELLGEMEELRKPARYLEAPIALTTEGMSRLLLSAESVFSELTTLLPKRTATRELPS